MQPENENNVVSMFEKAKQSEKPKVKKESSSESYDFEEIMKRNANNLGRQARDRTKANRGVIRSHRLKN